MALTSISLSNRYRDALASLPSLWYRATRCLTHSAQAGVSTNSQQHVGRYCLSARGTRTNVKCVFLHAILVLFSTQYFVGLENLSERDRAVLRSIFDPTATIGDVVDDGDTFLQDNDDAVECKESITMCAQGVRLAESGKLEEALEAMNRGVEAAPERPSAYNDRAQLLRLLGKDEEALSDIQRALSLTEGKRSRARALTLCQHGVLLRKRGANEEARAAFAEAAKLGSGFAKKQVVEMNPYAALCNQMLSQVMRGETDIKL